MNPLRIPLAVALLAAVCLCGCRSGAADAPGEPTAPAAESNASADLAAAIARADEPGVLDVDCTGWAPARDPAPTMSFHGAAWLERPERIDEENPPALIEALALEPGMNVADIGAGVGVHTALIAPEVAPGTVWATDIQPEMLAMLRERVVAENVETVLAAQASTGLPDGAIDLAIMVDVYHELAEADALIDDLARALAPDGRLVLVEFRAGDPSVPIKPEHAMTVHQATCELAHHGWTLAKRHDALPWQHVLWFAPPR